MPLVERTQVVTLARAKRNMGQLWESELPDPNVPPKPEQAEQFEIVQRTIVTQHRSHGTEREVSRETQEQVLATLSLSQLQHLSKTITDAIVDGLR